MSDFAKQIAKGLSSIRDIAGRQITYKRGGESLTLTAAVGDRNVDVATDYGVVEKVRVRQYLFSAKDLVLSNVKTQPQRGDLIVEIDAAVSRTYEITSPGGSVPDWQYSDAGRSTIRVFTRLIDES